MFIAGLLLQAIRLFAPIETRLIDLDEVILRQIER